MVQSRDCLRVRKDSTTQHTYAFEISFDTSLESFSGTFQDSSGEKYHWQGQHANKPLQNQAVPAWKSTATTSLSLSSVTPLGKPVTVKKISDDPPAYASNVAVPQHAKAQVKPDSSLSLQGLAHLSSLLVSQNLLPDGSTQEVVKDYAQEQANKCYERMLIASLPQNTRKKMFPQFVSLSEDEKSVCHPDFLERSTNITFVLDSRQTRGLLRCEFLCWAIFDL